MINYDIKEFEKMEKIGSKSNIEEYVRLFNYLIKEYDFSFIKFTNNENEKEKIDILHFFQYFYHNYKFYLSSTNTALFYEKK